MKTTDQGAYAQQRNITCSCWPSTKYETKSIKSAKKEKKNTQTHVHTLTVEKRKAVLVPSEGQTSQVFSADKNDLAYSTKHHHLSRGLVHTLSIIHVRVMEALCGPGRSLGGYRESSKDTDTETPVYTAYVQPTVNLL